MRLRRVRHAPITPGEYVRMHGQPARGEYVENLHGVAWDDAPIPPRRHACWPQSRAVLGGGMRAERCPCGAYRDEAGPWIERNTRTLRTPAGQAEHERGQAIGRLLDEFYAARRSGDSDRTARIGTRIMELSDDGPAG